MASNKTAPELFEFYSIVHDTEKMIIFMREKHLLPSSMKCGSCSEEMIMSKKNQNQMAKNGSVLCVCQLVPYGRTLYLRYVFKSSINIYMCVIKIVNN